MIKTAQFLASLFVLSFFCSANLLANENELIIPVAKNTEITIERHSAQGKYLIVWLAPQYGLRGGHRSLARTLAKKNIEVWQTDIIQSLFLPHSPTSLKKLDGKYVSQIIKHAHKITGKKIILMADSYAALTALTGARYWQATTQSETYLIGAILFSPHAYASIPPLGQLPEYMPIISASNIPMMIYQAKNSSNTGQFASLVEKLQQHGNPVYSRLTPRNMLRFYEEEPTQEMLALFKPLSENIEKMITVLERHSVPENPIPLKKAKQHKRGIDNYLKKYKGSIKPLPIKLKDAYGNQVIKNSYKGQITVINFWATWCPPCVKEIPSLNSLKQQMKGLPFELISINYAEDKKTILEFMKKVNVEFPVLLDHDGSFAKKWNVITYPSTFVIDKEGQIKYGVNAAIEWDNEEFIKKIKELL